MNLIITENALDHWVRGNSVTAQGVIVELVWRLVAAASPKPSIRRFPLTDSMGQPGTDGFLETQFPMLPFVPEGKSYWEIGTGVGAGSKATKDYKNRTKATPPEERQESTFIFVTPLSGRTDWQNTWQANSQASWIKKRKNKNEWRDVRVIDGTQLVDWVHQFPAVGKWLASKLGIPIEQIETLADRWEILRSIGEPPSLTPQLFLNNRETASLKLDELFSGALLQIKLSTYFPDQVVDFVGAYVANLDEESRVEIEGRCLIISGDDGLKAVSILNEPHVLVVAYDIDDQDTTATTLLAKARRARHATILRGVPGGIPHPGCVSMNSPRPHQIEAALVNAGYKEERARTLSQKCNGNLGALLRIIENFSAIPEWAQDGDAANLKIAEMLGGWVETSEGDQKVVEYLSGNSFGEWIESMRRVSHRSGTPLTHFAGNWKFVPRYEGWYAFGSQLSDGLLNRFEKIAIRVLGERDPKFELEPEERFAASFHQKMLIHSNRIRNGITETLALLGSLPDAITACSLGKPKSTATLVVRELLQDADWVLWASLNQQLPLLAEAAPEAFMEAVEHAFHADVCPFDILFSQEGEGIRGENYLIGLMWALETLAWSPDHFTRAMMLLGDLAHRDPGGTWANRPQRSLSTILLPWQPQTGATIQKRLAAVRILHNEHPDIGWKLLMDLLPDSSHMTWGSHKPAWQRFIDDEWSGEVTRAEYLEQIDLYAALAMQISREDRHKVAELLEHLDDLPPAQRDELIAHLQSDRVSSLAEVERLDMWEALLGIIRKQKKYPDAKWAMRSEELAKMDLVAQQLSPQTDILIFRRLFSARTFQLFDEQLDFEQQQGVLTERRISAVQTIFQRGGIDSILEFAEGVERPWHIGDAFGTFAPESVDSQLFPSLLDDTSVYKSQFAWGMVSSRLRIQSWAWFDAIDTSSWTNSQVGMLLSYLPFHSETWDRAAKRLQKDQGEYWRRACVNAYAADKQLSVACDRLIEYGRPYEALMCLELIVRNESNFDPQQAICALTEFSQTDQVADSPDSGMIVEIIGALQNDSRTDPDKLLAIELNYLPVLNEHFGGSPKLLEQKLADDPAFFSDAIRAVFRSSKEKEKEKEKEKTNPDEGKKRLATRIFKLLRNWGFVPGTHSDGTFHAPAFLAWLSAVKKSCKHSGHLDVALSQIGAVLIHSPADPNGLWIHESIAKELDAKDSERLRSGFRLALYNSRGVHWVDPTGQPERDLALKYRTHAEEVEMHGYFRLATTLRALATSYEREAEDIVKRSEFTD